MRLLYYKNKIESQSFESNWFDVIFFSPSLKRTYLKGETRSIKTTIVRLLFQTMTFGKSKLICAISESNDVIHTSYVVPKCFKFSFLSKDDYIIGPCYTHPDYRGQGIYPKILEFITNNIGNENTVFYMCVDDGNLPSIKGIEKAGFVKKNVVVEKSHFLKCYYIKGEVR